MTQATSWCETTPERLRGLYRVIRGELDAVEEVLRDELSSDFPFVDRLVKHGFRLGGKRLRPALVLLSGQACGELHAGHRILAAAIEMIHTATLIHDDVLDEATLRRHLETVNARWDNEASVLLGDYLFARAICLVTSLGDIFVCQAIAEACQRMCEGELRQEGSRGDYDLTEEEYLEIVAAKTAALCACCCRLGAHLAGGDAELQDVLAEYGRELGIAFQITDDVLDVKGSEAVAGKSLGTDLLKQKATLPLIRLLNQVDGRQRDELLAVLARADGQHVEALRPWFQRFDSISYAQQRAMVHTRRARQILDPVPATPACEALAELTDFIVTRQQ